MSEPIKDGGPAFPQIERVEDLENPAYGEMRATTGMSMRDWFAGLAMQSIIAATCSGAMRESEWDGAKKRTASDGYEIADAMLAERERKSK